jgi:hypothetical protein
MQKRRVKMKNLVKSLAVTAAMFMVFGLAAHKADASGVDFRIGLNIGIPVVAAAVFKTAPVYSHQPLPVYHVEKVRYTNGYVQRPGDYRYERVRHDSARHGSWNGNRHGSERDHNDRRGR